MIKEALRCWHQFWTRTAPPHVQAIFRIAFGSFLLYYALPYFPHLKIVFSNEGLVLPLYVDYAPAYLTWLLAAPPYPVVLTAAIALCIALVCFTIGFRTRLAALMCALLGLYFWQLGLHLFPASYNRIFCFFLFVLSVSGAGATYSVDTWLKHTSWTAWEPVSVFAQRIIAVQITLTYLGVGWQKMVLEAWDGGEVLSYALITRWGTPFAFWFSQLGLPMEFYDWSVWLITGFEILLPFAFWIKPFRIPFMIGGAIFHIFITLMLDIWWFMVMIPAYIIFFSPEEVYTAISTCLDYVQKKIDYYSRHSRRSKRA